MGEALPGPAPEEPRASCAACPMTASDEDPGVPGLFHPSTKCCASEPALPNYLVGMILDGPEEGAGSMAARLRTGVGVGPLGVEGGRLGELLRRSALPEVHGRAPEFRCPHYLDEGGGTCGIHRHRNALCSTWFCRHDRGRVSLGFWLALRRLLEEVERDLARACVLELDPGPEARALLLEERDSGPILLDEHDLGRRADPERRARIWGRWLGQEEAFYWACASLVTNLSWPEILARCGPGVRLAHRSAEERWRALSRHELPSVLKLAPLQVQGAGSGGVLVGTYLRTDPLRLSPELMAALSCFDGTASVDETLIRIEESLGISLEPALLQRLGDFGVLDPA